MNIKLFRNLSWFLRVLILIGVGIIFYIGYFPIGILEILIVFGSMLALRSKRRIVVLSEFLILFLFLLNVLGILVFYNFSFYDIIMHILGGVVLVVMVYGILEWKIKNRKWVGILSGVVLVFVVFAWEFYEVAWDVFVTPNFNIPMTQRDLFDTFLDVILGLVGGLITLVVLVRKNI